MQRSFEEVHQVFHERLRQTESLFAVRSSLVTIADSAGRLYGDPSAWQIVDNKILKLDGANDLLYSEELLEIQKIEIYSQIPLIYTEEDRFPMVIPTCFLDVSRDTTSNRYYIKSEYLK